jgi:hypothetical protein
VDGQQSKGVTDRNGTGPPSRMVHERARGGQEADMMRAEEDRDFWRTKLSREIMSSCCVVERRHNLGSRKVRQGMLW